MRPIESPAQSSVRVAVAFSGGIRKLRHIERFLDVERVVAPRSWSSADAWQSVVLVWGRKQNAAKAHAFAKRHCLPVWYLEDGFIRSCASDPHGRLSYSLLVDTTGVYYDSGEPSQLENLLNLPDEQFARLATVEALAEVASCRSLLVEHEITKYNYCKPAAVPGPPQGYFSSRGEGTNNLHSSNRSTPDDAGVVQAPVPASPLILVIDQTRDDASVRCGGMQAENFTHMLHAAIGENPGAQVMLRTHPDVVSGRRSGYLDAEARRAGIAVIAEHDNPMGWLKRASRVYVATSQLGYEALLCGCDVVTFGQPFYAGWGLTDDRSPVARRTRKRSVDELFLVCHVHLPRYCHPVTGERWNLRQCIEHVRLQKREFARNAFRFHTRGITRWKRGYVRQYLRSPYGGPDTWATWSFRDAGLGTPDGYTWPTMRVEDGFLRSSGLGSDFVAPGSLVTDSRGLYFDPTGPSDLEHLLNTRDCSPAEVERAMRLRHAIVGSRLSKYNLDTGSQPIWRSADKTTVLVIGQVDGDQSVRRGSPRVRDNRALLEAVRLARPGSAVVYRPHPDVVSGNRGGRIDEVLSLGLADAVDTDSHIIDCIDACDELHTMTSQAGFEALMRGCPVVTHGLPFYAGWGLTEDHLSTPRRVRERTLDELVYLTLIVYARYVDIGTGEFISPEDRVLALRRESRTTGAVRRRTPGARLGKLANMVKGLRYAP